MNQNQNAAPRELSLADERWERREYYDQGVRYIWNDDVDFKYFCKYVLAIAAFIAIIVAVNIYSEYKNGASIDHRTLGYVGLIAYAVLCLCACCEYEHERSKRYFLADLPFKSWRRVVLLVLTLELTPFYIVSYIAMKRWEKRVQYQPRIATIEENLWTSLAPPQPDEKLIKGFAAFYKGSELHQAKLRCNTAYHKVEDQQSQLEKARLALQECETALVAAQEEYEKAQSNYYATEGVLAATQTNYDKVQEDYCALENSNAVMQSETAKFCAEQRLRLCSMPGVTAVELCDQGGTSELRIVLKVRSSFQHEIYDFGDYEICIDQTSAWSCRFLRSTLTVPFFHYSGRIWLDDDDEIIFDEQVEAKIVEFLDVSRIADAVECISKDLHWRAIRQVGSHVPQFFQRVIPPVEKDSAETPPGADVSYGV